MSVAIPTSAVSTDRPELDLADIGPVAAPPSGEVPPAMVSANDAGDVKMEAAGDGAKSVAVGDRTEAGPSGEKGAGGEVAGERDEEPLVVDLQLEDLDGFEWSQGCRETIRQLATTGVVPLPTDSAEPSSSTASPFHSWPHLRRILLYRLRYVITSSYLPRGSRAVVDTRVEPRGSGGWLWGEEEIKKEFARIADALDDFEEAITPEEASISEKVAFAAAPFTIQRLSELLLPEPPDLHPHYNTLPKFLRAIVRVLTVTSSVSAFPPPPPDADDASNAAMEGVQINGTSATPSPSPSPAASPALRSRRASSLTPLPSLLEPIPWLVNISAESSAEAPAVTSPPTHALNLSPPPPNGGAAARALSPPSSVLSSASTSAAVVARALSPDAPGAGGRVDEVDAGLGTAEELPQGEAPVAIAGEALMASPRVSARRGSASPSPGPEAGLPATASVERKVEDSEEVHGIGKETDRSADDEKRAEDAMDVS